MLKALRNALVLPELRNRILFTIFILAIYRLISHIPVPGVNVEVLRTIQQSVQGGTAGGLGNLVGLLSLLSGGAVANFSVLSMGVYPYVTAQLILQLLIPIIPRLEEIAKEDPSAILNLVVEPAFGLQPFQARELAFKLGLNLKQVSRARLGPAQGVEAASLEGSRPRRLRAL